MPSNKKTLEEKVDEMHTILVRLETLWNGGPGHWDSCVSHRENLERMDKRQQWILKSIWMASGAFVVVVWYLEHFAK